MSELERDLRALGAALELPPTPDVASAVRTRIARRTRRRFERRRALVIALAMLVAAFAAVMAVPQARTAVLEWLGLRGVRIERVPEPPKAPPGAELALGERVTLEEARRRAGFPVRVPARPDLAAPDAVYFSETHVSGGYVALVYGSEKRAVLLVTQFRASIEERFLHKVAGAGTRIERVTVAGGRGDWLEGEVHEVVYVGRDGNPIVDTRRLAGNTLLWEHGEVTLRLEGDLTKEEALRIAESMR